jgi:hypothetical protein
MAAHTLEPTPPIAAPALSAKSFNKLAAAALRLLSKSGSAALKSSHSFDARGAISACGASLDTPASADA